MLGGLDRKPAARVRRRPRCGAGRGRQRRSRRAGFQPHSALGGASHAGRRRPNDGPDDHAARRHAGARDRADEERLRLVRDPSAPHAALGHQVGAGAGDAGDGGAGDRDQLHEGRARRLPAAHPARQRPARHLAARERPHEGDAAARRPGRADPDRPGRSEAADGREGPPAGAGGIQRRAGGIRRSAAPAPGRAQPRLERDQVLAERRRHRRAPDARTGRGALADPGHGNRNSQGESAPPVREVLPGRQRGRARDRWDRPRSLSGSADRRADRRSRRVRLGRRARRDLLLHGARRPVDAQVPVARRRSLPPTRRWPVAIRSAGVDGLAVKRGLTPTLIGAVSTAARGAAPGFMPRDAGAARPVAPPPWDIAASITVTTAIVLLLTGLATALGPSLTGILATYPLYGAILAGFAHHLDGPGPAIRVLRGLLLGLFAFAGFFFVLALSLERAGIAQAFAAAIAAALILQIGALWVMRRDSGA